MQAKNEIVGRYAPSPSGDQHLGNLRTALLAWLHTRLQNGYFIVRMEDLDTPRTVQGSDIQILKDLEWLGIDWDGEVVYQSQRTNLYEAALKSLIKQQLVYPCFCSRKDIQQAASAPHLQGAVYPGNCAALNSDEVTARRQDKDPALRLRVSPQLAQSCGDFIIKRADGLFAYQLAVVVDDLEQGVSEVIRGDDLANCTERQQYLAGLLQPALKPMSYLHCPLLHDENGQRLSKRYGPVSARNYRADGVSAQQLIGELMHGIGLLDKSEPISTSDLLQELSLDQVRAVLSID